MSVKKLSKKEEKAKKILQGIINNGGQVKWNNSFGGITARYLLNHGWLVKLVLSQGRKFAAVTKKGAEYFKLELPKTAIQPKIAKLEKIEEIENKIKLEEEKVRKLILDKLAEIGLKVSENTNIRVLLTLSGFEIEGYIEYDPERFKLE